MEASQRLCAFLHRRRTACPAWAPDGSRILHAQTGFRVGLRLWLRLAVSPEEIDRSSSNRVASTSPPPRATSFLLHRHHRRCLLFAPLPRRLLPFAPLPPPFCCTSQPRLHVLSQEIRGPRLEATNATPSSPPVDARRKEGASKIAGGGASCSVAACPRLDFDGLLRPRLLRADPASSGQTRRHVDAIPVLRHIVVSTSSRRPQGATRPMSSRPARRGKPLSSSSPPLLAAKELIR